MDKLTAAETETAELHNKVEDLEYNYDASKARIDKYDRHLADAMSKVRTYEEGTVTIQGGGEGVSRKKVWLRFFIFNDLNTFWDLKFYGYL